ncbi:MAG TPA: glycosyltransferase family 39 protein [Candidatus Limnocylindrales bacterium]|nr:glycosyltransferase family 39 protein [Candidatus Limnocylindrales bacterium]
MFQPLREFKIGRPQIFAGLMLLGFLAQCLWVSGGRKFSQLEYQYIASGFPQQPGLEYRVTSPLTGFVAALPFKLARHAGWLNQTRGVPRLWVARLPFAVFGLWLGAALWWVSRRLFDNEGGYVALALYCSSPAMAMIASNTGPEIILAWSSFGLIYTSIGVAHTLYAPPRKWLPRMVLLGLSIGCCLATALWSFTLVLLAFAFMLYLAPGRRRAAAGVLLGSSAIGIAVLALILGVTGSPWLATKGLVAPHPSLELLRSLAFPFADGYTPLGSYLFVAFFIVALTTYGSWDRARYFGNTAPLLSAYASVLLFALVPGAYVWNATLGLSFVFVFVGGVAADLLETSGRRLAAIILTAGLLLRVVLGLVALSRWIRYPV